MSIPSKAEFFLNFQQFGDLKLGARNNSDEAGQAVAQQFEGLFVQQMLAAMRSAANLDTSQDSSYMDFYQEMYDKQLAQSIARQGGLGVAKLILQNMPGNEGLPAQGAGPVSNETVLDMELPRVKTVVLEPGAVAQKMAVVPDANVSPVRAPVDTATNTSSARTSRVVDDDFAEVSSIERANSRWHNPDNFVADIMPQARLAADKLGVSARLLIAQSALETGWGKYAMKLDDGRSSNNLFGIKAGPEWRGSSLRKASLELQDGVLQNQVSSFRVYASPAQSFTDYVEFIRTNPRYRQALELADDDRAYIREIHKAGYATDPQYADKVLNILNSEVMQRSLARLDAEVKDHA